MEAVKFISTVRRMSVAMAMSKSNIEFLPSLPLPPPTIEDDPQE